jgi:hypothetical protein
MSMGMPPPKKNKDPQIICEYCKIKFEDAKTGLCKVSSPALFGSHAWMRLKMTNE